MTCKAARERESREVRLRIRNKSKKQEGET